MLLLRWNFNSSLWETRIWCPKYECRRLEYTRRHAVITIIQLKTLSSPQVAHYKPFFTLLPKLLVPRSLLSPSVGLLVLDILYNGIIQYTALCDWLISLSINLLLFVLKFTLYNSGSWKFAIHLLSSVCPPMAISVSKICLCCSMCQHFTPVRCQAIFCYLDIEIFLFICQLTDIWVVSSFWLLCVMLLWTFVYRLLGGCVFCLLLGRHLWV